MLSSGTEKIKLKEICITHYQRCKQSFSFPDCDMPLKEKNTNNFFLPDVVFCKTNLSNLKGDSPYLLSALDFDIQFEILSLINWIFFLSLNWIFAGYTGSKNPVQTWKKIQFIKLEILD